MKKLPLVIMLAVLTSGLKAQEGFIGEIRLFAGNFAPRYWSFCDGKMLSIQQHTALFSILGTIYGGDGRTTFALPKLDAPGKKELIYKSEVSTAGGMNTTFAVRNRYKEPVSMYWIDFKGNAKLYATIKPGETIVQQSAGWHVWHFSTKKELIETIKLENKSVQNITLEPPSDVKYIICLTGIFPSRN